MHLGSRAPESDLAHYTPRALLFEALKKRTFSGENFNSLLNESRIHKSLASGDANQTLEEVDGKSPQSSFQISLPVLPHNASPEESGGTKRVNISAQSQLSFLSDDYKETSVNVQQMPKSLLFDKLKRMPSALQPVQVADKRSDSKAARTVSQSSDSSGIPAESSIQSTLKQTESTKTLSDVEMPELLNSSNSKQTECIKHTPEKLKIRHKGSGFKRKTCTKNPIVMLSRISQNNDSIECHDDNLADDSHEKKQFHTCSPFKSSNSQQVLDESTDCCAPVLVRSTLISASSVSHGHALNKTNYNRETRASSSGISMPNLLPSTEFLLPQNLASESESHSANDRLFNRKSVRNVRHAASSSVDREVSSSREDVQSSSDEVFESRPTPVERASSINQSGETTDNQSLSKPTRPSKRRSLHLRKQDSHSLSSKGDAAVITEDHLSSTGSELEGHQNVVELDKWTLRLVSDQHLSLAGYKKDEPGGRLHCSDPVTRCLRKDVVETTSGILYHLSGRLCKTTATEAGLSNKFLHSFLDGFPPNWEDLLKSALTKISSRKPQVQKVLEAKLLSNSVEDNRGSCEPVKNVKSAAALNNACVAKIVLKGSKNDPLTLQDLPVTRRSGRLVFPPLAWWANQRVMVDPTSNATIIAQENENRLDLPAVHFKSSCEIPSEEVGEEPQEIKKKDVEMKEQKATKDEKQLVETSSKKQRGRPHKSSGVMMQEIKIESSSSTAVIKDRQGIWSEGGQLKDESVSEDCVIESKLQTSTRRKKNQSGEVLGFNDSRWSYRKQEKLIEASRSCSTSSVDTACYSAQKKQRLNLKNYGDYQPGSFSSADCPQSSQVPQRTSPQTDSRKSLTINRKRSMKSDLTEETSGSSRSRRSCNVERDRNEVKVPVQNGAKLNRTLTLQDSKVIQNFEKQIKQNSKHHCHEKLLNRKENERMDHESEGMKKTWSGSVVPPNHKTILRNENTGEKGGQKKLRQRRSSKVDSPSHKYKNTCSKQSSVQQRSRLNSDSGESWPAAEESAQKRTKKHSRKDLRSPESVELVYAKSDHLQKMVVMRHDSKKRRECATKDQFSFLTKSPMPMQGLPPKPRPSRFHACGNLSDQCDSDDSANVEYFFSSDESET